jgi:hypothetical protein
MVDLEAEQQAIIEHRRMIDAIGIADERVGETAEIEQAVPIGVVAREAVHFEASTDANMSERDFCAARRAKPLLSNDAGARQAPRSWSIYNDRLRRPAERGHLGSMLTLRGFTIVLDMEAIDE